MSGGNIDYEIDSGGGENTFFDKIILDDNSDYANLIAGEIVNEILENALDIATKASETGIDWRDIKKSRSRLSMSSSRNNMSDLQENSLKLDEICNNIVGTMVENIQGSPPDNVNNILDSLNNIRLHENEASNKHSVQPLDVEMKTLLHEMMTPPYQVLQYNCMPVIGAVGDQPVNSKSQTELQASELPPEAILCAKPVEKKSRVTDLIKNSPRTVAEYLHQIDSTTKQNQEEWEEVEEKFLNVIELECVEPGHEPFRAATKTLPESPKTESDDEKIITMPKVDIMDTVDLSAKAFREEELQLISEKEESDGAKGDEPIRKRNVIIVHNETPCEKMPDVRPLNPNIILHNDEKSKKRKWGLGRRIWGFFKKGNKQSLESSTSN